MYVYKSSIIFILENNKSRVILKIPIIQYEKNLLHRKFP